VIATAFGFALPQDRAVLSSGADANLVDALSAGALGQAIVLAAPTTLPAVSANWLAAGPTRLVVAGGSGALGDAVLLAAARTTA
jgi:hypothetical protein